MFRRILRNPGNDFLEILQKQSYVTAELSEAFRGDLERYYFLSFFETIHMPVFGLVRSTLASLLFRFKNRPVSNMLGLAI